MQLTNRLLSLMNRYTDEYPLSSIKIACSCIFKAFKPKPVIYLAYETQADRIHPYYCLERFVHQRSFIELCQQPYTEGFAYLFQKPVNTSLLSNHTDKLFLWKLSLCGATVFCVPALFTWHRLFHLNINRDHHSALFAGVSFLYPGIEF